MHSGTIRHHGRQILEPILEPHEFIYVEGKSGVGSGGAYARGEFVRATVAKRKRGFKALS